MSQKFDGTSQRQRDPTSIEIQVSGHDHEGMGVLNLLLLSDVLQLLSDVLQLLSDMLQLSSVVLFLFSAMLQWWLQLKSVVFAGSIIFSGEFVVNLIHRIISGCFMVLVNHLKYVPYKFIMFSVIFVDCVRMCSCCITIDSGYGCYVLCVFAVRREGHGSKQLSRWLRTYVKK